MLNWHEIFFINHLILQISFKTALFYTCIFLFYLTSMSKRSWGYMDRLVSYACVVCPFFIMMEPKNNFKKGDLWGAKIKGTLACDKGREN